MNEEIQYKWEKRSRRVTFQVRESDFLKWKAEAQRVGVSTTRWAEVTLNDKVRRNKQRRKNNVELD
jgi:hypothetical protein